MTSTVITGAVHPGDIVTVQIKKRLSVIREAAPYEAPSVPWQRPVLKSTRVSKPWLHDNAVAYVDDVLRSGWWGYGQVAQHLQATIEALYAGEQNALATASCTSAMHLALRAAGVGPGDEVIVPASTYVSTAVVAVYVGATPVFADVDPTSLTLSAETVERELTGRTRAVIAMHYAGPAADFDPIELVAGRDVTVIEDAAHAFGSRRNGRLVGTNAAFAAFSFAPTKQIASSNGGLLLFQDGDQRTELDQLAFLGLTADAFDRTLAEGVSPTQQVARIGHKYKIDDVAAAVACAGVEQLDEIIGQRARLADRYYARLDHLDAVQMLPRHPGATVSWYIMPVRVPEDRRDGLRAHLAAHNIDTAVHYPSLLEQPAFRGARGAAPVTARETRRLLSLPMHGALTLDEVDRICDLVRDFVS